MQVPSEPQSLDKEAASWVEDLNRSNMTGLKTNEKNLVRKQDLRIMPLSAAIFLLCYLDRSNIGRLLFVNMANLTIFRHANEHRKC
jgi:hypothetical protein